MSRRFFETAFLRHLLKHPSVQLHRNQAGFRRGYSTISHILTAHETCRLPLRHRHSVSIFLDLTKAFDRVRHKPLLDYLTSRGCAEPIRNLLYFLMMHDCKSHIVVNGLRSHAIHRHRGVFQGSILAPLLFNIAMDYLAHDLYALDQGSGPPAFLFFADDIRLSAHKKDIHILHDALKISEKWGLHFGLSFGIKKCGVVGDCTEAFRIQDSIIPHVPSYKYLGIRMDSEGIMWTHLEDLLATKAEKSLRFLAIVSTPKWNHATRLALVKTYVISLASSPFPSYLPPPTTFRTLLTSLHPLSTPKRPRRLPLGSAKCRPHQHYFDSFYFLNWTLSELFVSNSFYLHSKFHPVSWIYHFSTSFFFFFSVDRHRRPLSSVACRLRPSRGRAR